MRYRLPGGAVVQTAWKPADDQLLEVGSPFGTVATYVLRPQGSFEGVASVSGDLVYDDPANGYSVTVPFELTSLTAAQSVNIGILPGAAATATWRARLTRADGSGATLGPASSEPGTVWVGTDVDFLTIRVEPALLDFDTDVKLALVELHYVDPAAEIDERTTLTFSKTANSAQEWRVARSDRAKSRYDAHIRLFGYDAAKNAEVQRSQIDDQVLLLERS